jgi:UDP-glucose 4-epimerase
MQKVLVTGGLGFIGSNLVDILKENYSCEVIVIDNLASDSSDKCYMRDDVEYWIEDIRNINNGEYDKGVDTIFHLAALARIQPSFENPLETISVDCYGTAEICEYARRNGSKVVYAGSSSFYGGAYLNPYAFAKWQGEEMCKLYSECFAVNTAIARFFNVYGDRQPESGPYATVVGIFEKLYREGNPLTITGDGEQRRDFTHVNDICSGLIEISKKDWRGEIFNLGTSTNHSINELARLYKNSETRYIPARPGEARNTLADISKTTEKTGWQPAYSLEDYVLKTTNKGKDI